MRQKFPQVMRVGLLALGLLLAAPVTHADGVFVPAPGRVDMVHDAARNRVYISAGDRVLRYATKFDIFRSPIVLGGQLGGLDISPDGKTLVVADRASSGTRAWVWLVDLDTLEARKIETQKGYDLETGTFVAVYGGDGKIYTTSGFAGSGWIPLRRLDPATEQWTTVAEVTQNTMLSPSGDGNTIVFAETNISDGRWGLYRISDATLVRRQWYTDGTSWFNYEIAANHDGSQYLIPTYGGGLVYDAAYQKLATLGTYAGAQPVGVAYHPVASEFYVPFAGTEELRAYDAGNFSLLRTWKVGSLFTQNGNFAFVSGRTRISRDGSLLMVSVADGVQLIRQYAPLRADTVGASVAAGASVDIPLAGSIGNGASLVYSLASTPPVGSASLVNGNTVRYQAPLGVSGLVSFRYRVKYGSAIAENEVQIEVAFNPNRAPVANNDSAIFQANTPVLIAVLANDSDPDGDVISLVSLQQPAAGSARIVGNQLEYTPAPGVNSEVFGYGISDGRGGMAQALVTVSKRSRAAALALPIRQLKPRVVPGH